MRVKDNALPPVVTAKLWCALCTRSFYVSHPTTQQPTRKYCSKRCSQMAYDKRVKIRAEYAEEVDQQVKLLPLVHKSKMLNGVCTRSNKTRFTSRMRALIFIAVLATKDDPSMTAYSCSACEAWHIGHGSRNRSMEQQTLIDLIRDRYAVLSPSKR